MIVQTEDFEYQGNVYPTIYVLDNDNVECRFAPESLGNQFTLPFTKEMEWADEQFFGYLRDEIFDDLKRENTKSLRKALKESWNEYFNQVV